MLLLGIVLAFDLYSCRMMSGQELLSDLFLYICSSTVCLHHAVFMDLPCTCKVLQHYQKSASQFHSDVHPPSSVYHTDDGDHRRHLYCFGIFVAQAFPFMILFYIMLGFATVAGINSRFCKTLRQLHPWGCRKRYRRKRRRKSHRHQHILQPAPDRTAKGGRKGERGRNPSLIQNRKKTRDR